MNFIEHYGVKGMKWGVRRTPEQLGHRTRTNKDVDAIVKSMSKSDLEKLNLYEDYSHKNLVHRQLKKISDKPISFFDISDEDGYLNVSLGTRGGNEYRNKGYASAVTKQGVDWWEKNRSQYGDRKLSWWVLEDNKGSIRLAEKYGFRQNKKDSKRFKGWRHYEL